MGARKIGMKRWMQILMIAFTLIGVVATFGALDLTYVWSRDYILADPARLEGAKAFALMVGTILGAFAFGLGCLKIVGYYFGIYDFAPIRWMRRRNHGGRSDRREATC